MNRGRGRPSRATILAEIDAGERCECGILVDRHPPLPAPLPWEHGRPCGRLDPGGFARRRGLTSSPPQPPA